LTCKFFAPLIPWYGRDVGIGIHIWPRPQPKLARLVMLYPIHFESSLSHGHDPPLAPQANVPSSTWLLPRYVLAFKHTAPRATRQAISGQSNTETPQRLTQGIMQPMPLKYGRRSAPKPPPTGPLDQIPLTPLYAIRLSWSLLLAATSLWSPPLFDSSRAGQIANFLRTLKRPPENHVRSSPFSRGG